MYCPECLVEYREGFTRCADCQVPLKPGVPPPQPPDRALDLVPVLDCYEPIALTLAKASLEEAGIPFMVQSDEVAVRNVCVPHTQAKARILVRRDCAEEARALLEPLEEGEA